MLTLQAMWRGPGKTLALLAMGALSVLGMTGCSLLLDFSEPPAPPADASVDASPDAAIIDPALCSAYEPNEDPVNAREITPGSSLAAAICTDVDRDFYKFTLAADQTVTIEVVFTHAQGDLALTLYDNAVPPDELAAIDTQDDNEVDTRLLPAGTYVIQVLSNVQALNSYTLNLGVSAAQ